ncbi:gas vesicle protein GvpJ [Streptomyces sp. NPDC047002]|uniref:gas vesicle protein n=1 Tax=Streptomyces sp. NPDC047002 TaxID=3155475 RepID=UPI0034512491
MGGPPAGAPYGAAAPGSSANLADILERVLDKGVVIAGDIQINLLDIELLTIKLRLLVASVDKAKEMGIDWWEHDPSLSSRARDDAPGRQMQAGHPGGRPVDSGQADEIARLRAEVAELRAAAGPLPEPSGEAEGPGAPGEDAGSGRGRSERAGRGERSGER